MSCSCSFSGTQIFRDTRCPQHGSHEYRAPQFRDPEIEEAKRDEYSQLVADMKELRRRVKVLEAALIERADSSE